MATGTRDELDKLAMNNKSQVKRTTCDICRERKVRCDRNKPECLRCRRSGYKCTYPSENSNAAKLTEALQELNNRLRHAETMIQTSTILKEDNPRRDSPQAHAPQASTDFTSLLDSIEFAQTIQDDQLFSWEKLAASDFDAVFSHSEDATQWPEMKKNEFTSSKELCEIDQMEDISCGGGFDPSNGSANPSSRPSPNIIENIQLHGKTCEDLFKKYFGVIQKHFPLVDQDKFMQSTVLSNASQAQALKYAICMAGAHINKDSHREKQFYVAARYHLEQAELEVQGSLFWSLEAAQALVLVARYELTHINSPRALISISRLDRLVSILQRRLDNPTSDQALLQVPRLDSSSHFEIRRTFFLALSLKYRNLTAAQIHDDAESHFACMQPPRLSTAYTLPGPLSVFDRISPSKVETLDSFSIFMVCWRITSDADSHRRETAVDAAGPTVEYNYCHVHDRIDQEIGIIVSYLASSHLSTESLDNELLVLAMIIILGARIQLFNTAILHSSMAGFLKPAIDECLQQNISTAKDISDIILQAQMLDTSRVAIYREASFYIMPPLALAAEAHMRLAKAKASKINGAGSGNTQHYLSPETRESLGVLYMAMEACKDETGRYTDLLSECQGFLGASGSGKRLRTEFTNLGRRAASSSE